MPYKSQERQNSYQKFLMRRRRAKLRLEGRFVRPDVRPVMVDADGNVMPEFT